MPLTQLLQPTSTSLYFVNKSRVRTESTGSSLDRKIGQRTVSLALEGLKIFPSTFIGSLTCSCLSLVIPGEAQLKYGVRAPTAREVMDLVPRVLNCFKAAALSSGCSHEITISHAYLDLQPCTTLEKAYQEFCKERWGPEGYVVPARSLISASTDFVSVD
jgi:hypothetical protein